MQVFWNTGTQVLSRTSRIVASSTNKKKKARDRSIPSSGETWPQRLRDGSWMFHPAPSGTRARNSKYLMLLSPLRSPKGGEIEQRKGPSPTMSPPSNAPRKIGTDYRFADTSVTTRVENARLAGNDCNSAFVQLSHSRLIFLRSFLSSTSGRHVSPRSSFSSLQYASL